MIVAEMERKAGRDRPPSIALQFAGRGMVTDARGRTNSGPRAGGGSMPVRDRSDAGRRLGRALKRRRLQWPVVFALPRGGVPVAVEVCAALDAPLDLVFARKIGVPIAPELAMGAIGEGGEPVRNEDVIALMGVTEAQFAAVCGRERREIARRRRRYLGDRAPAEGADPPPLPVAA